VHALAQARGASRRHLEAIEIREHVRQQVHAAPCRRERQECGVCVRGSGKFIGTKGVGAGAGVHTDVVRNWSASLSLLCLCLSLYVCTIAEGVSEGASHRGATGATGFLVAPLTATTATPVAGTLLYTMLKCFSCQHRCSFIRMLHCRACGFRIVRSEMAGRSLCDHSESGAGRRCS
jgi:hypothetical protein